MFICQAGVFIGICAPKADYLAGFYPNPVDNTFPRITWSTKLGSSWVYYNRPYILKEANWVALNPVSIPSKDPTGVLFADIKNDLINKIKNNINYINYFG